MEWNNFGHAVWAAVETIAPSKRLFLGTDGRVEWETLVTGIVAVLVAVLTVMKLSEQIRQTERLAVDQRKRRARAARAMLPLALSEIADYATTCILGLYALRSCFRPDGALDRPQIADCLTAWASPRLPENVLSLLKECIEFSDDGPAEAMAELVRHFQVQNSRILDNISRIRLNDGVHLVLWANIEQDIQDAAELYARASVLLPFSKGSTSQVSDIGRQLIHNALMVAGCFNNLSEIDALSDRWARAFPHRAETEEVGLRSLGLKCTH